MERVWTIADHAKFDLQMHYGNPSRAITSLERAVRKYKAAHQTPSVIARIESLQKRINHIKNQ